MKRTTLILAFLAGTLPCLAGTVPVPEWDKSFGGSKEESLACLKQTADGGYILGGTSDSGSGELKSAGSAGKTDFWLVKTDAGGNRLWDKSFGGTDLEMFHTLQQTTDGGFILGGSSQSGISETKSQANLGSYDFWIVKTDGQGNKLWDRTFGGEGLDFLYSLTQTPDGGYIIGGVSLPKKEDAAMVALAQQAQYLIIKLDANGNKIWTKTINNIDADSWEPFVMHLTPDNGFILAGSLNSVDLGNATVASKGASDFHLIKLNAAGNQEWENVYGGKDDEFLSSLQLATDGGYILGGISHSGKTGDKTESAHGNGDFWVIKVNNHGEKLWDKAFGGSEYEYLSGLKQTQDEGFLLGGISRSGKSGDKSQATYGKADFWIVKLDANGNKVYEQAYGGASDDELYAFTETIEGGVLLGGNSNSTFDANKTAATLGGKDIWLLKLKVPAISWYSF